MSLYPSISFFQELADGRTSPASTLRDTDEDDEDWREEHARQARTESSTYPSSMGESITYGIHGTGDFVEYARKKKAEVVFTDVVVVVVLSLVLFLFFSRE